MRRNVGPLVEGGGTRGRRGDEVQIARIEYTQDEARIQSVPETRGLAWTNLKKNYSRGGYCIPKRME